MTTRMQLERAMLATPAARALDANSLAQLRSHIPRLSDAELASLIRANVGNVQTRTTWKTDPIRTDQAKLARYLKQVEATTIAAAKAGSSPARTHEQNKAEAFKVGAYVGKKATREAAARCIDNRFKQGLVTPAQAERVLAATQAQHLGLNGDLFAQQVIISDSEAWQRVQRTVLSEVRPVFDREMGEVYNEMRGIQHRMEARSLTETGAGILLSWFLDPQIMLTAGVRVSQLLGIVYTPPTTTSQYAAFTAPGLTYVWDAEGAVSADASTTYNGPNIDIFSARAFVPFTISFGMDQPGWQDNATQMLTEAFNETASAATATGTGNGQPYGVFPQMMSLTAGSGAAHVVVQTAGQVGAVDIRQAWSQVPERFRPSASWVMNPAVAQAVSAAASPGAPNALAPGDYHILPTGQKLLMGHPVYEVDDAPSLLNSTASTSAFLVVGDFGRGYCAPQRSFTVELVPQLLDFAGGTGRPISQRAWLATARFGGGVIIPQALRVLANA